MSRVSSLRREQGELSEKRVREGALRVVTRKQALVSLKNTFQPHLKLIYNKNKMINYDAIDSYKNWLFNNLELIYNTKTFSHVNSSLYCELC